MYYIIPNEAAGKLNVDPNDYCINVNAFEYNAEYKKYNFDNTYWNNGLINFMRNNPNAKLSDYYVNAQNLLRNCGYIGKSDFYNTNGILSDKTFGGNTAMVVTNGGKFKMFCANTAEWFIELCGGYSIWHIILSFIIVTIVIVLAVWGIASGEGIFAIIGVGTLLPAFFGLILCSWLLAPLLTIGAILIVVIVAAIATGNADMLVDLFG